MNNIKKELSWAIELLRNAGINTAQLDTEVLLAYVLNIDRVSLYLNQEIVLDIEKVNRFKSLIERRLTHTPISYLTGHKEFMSLDFKVNENVLIPRPETEILTEYVIESYINHSEILEIGTGSGVIAISIAKYKQNASVLATDLSINALILARENAVINGVEKRISFVQTDLFDAISMDYKFNWIVSNPPYVPTHDIEKLSKEIKYEPVMALDGGKDGLNIIRKIICNAYKFLAPNGRLAIEIGYGQSEAVLKIAKEIGKYSDYSFINDYAGIPRVFCCSKYKEVSNG
ncbi:MAG: peptide chain release factor N(5)-glutamine methyltransferase [Candidatus Poribacteria bacterium]